MGFLKGLKKSFKRIAKQHRKQMASKAASNLKKHGSSLSSEKREKLEKMASYTPSFSASEDKKTESQNLAPLSKGRMKETDVIKGPDCTIPAEPGLYRHVNKKTGAVEYVGQANNIRKRQQEHERANKLDPKKQKVAYKVAKPEATKDDLLEGEKKHIKKNKPKGNKYAGGNGRR